MTRCCACEALKRATSRANSAPRTPLIECHTRISAPCDDAAHNKSTMEAMRNMRRAVYSRLAMAAIHERSAAELASAYAHGELSPLHVARALLERIDVWEPRINAMYRVHREAALDQARASEARWRAGRPLSALDGVPIT